MIESILSNHSFSIEKLMLSPFIESETEVYILRLDQIHPLYGGNKLLKLLPFLKQFETGEFIGVASMGGAFSNHLIALSAVCKKLEIPLTAYIRSYKEDNNNPLVRWIKSNGTKITYVRPDEYKRMSKNYISPINDERILWIPEGGFRPDAFTIPDLNLLTDEDFDIAVPAGTGTTAVGFAQQFSNGRINVFPAIKNWQLPSKFDINPGNLNIVKGYEFGGFAKWDQSLIDFMHALYKYCNLATDIIYTSKMLFGICDILRNNPEYFERPLVIIHTGGLTGNIGFDYRFPGVLSEELVSTELLL